MEIKARMSRSANTIGSNNRSSKGGREPRNVKKLGPPRGALGNMNKTTPGEINIRSRKEKSDPNLMSSNFKTSSDQEKPERPGKDESKTSKNLFNRRGIIQGFINMVPVPETQLTKPNRNVKGLKSSNNVDIHKVSFKNDLRPKNSSGVLPSRSKHSPSLMKTQFLNNTKSVEGQRPSLKMPASVPKQNRKLKYVIAVVGNEIKLVDPKTKGLGVSSEYKPYFTPKFRKTATVSRKNLRGINKGKRRNKAKQVKTRRSERTNIGLDSPMNPCHEKLDNNEVRQDDQDSDGMVISLNTADLTDVEVPDREGLRKMYKFSDRRTKAEIPLKAVQTCTGEEILLERLDPISNILSTELLDSVKRCQSIIDFVTAPIENQNPPFTMKQIFYDTTVMEELNFSPLTTAELRSTAVPELKLVPSVPQQVRRSLSFPDLVVVGPKQASRPLYCLARKKKKKPKIETILATRPKGFQHAKWLEKTVGPDSTLKCKLLQDVIISQVRKCLKRQAELRQKWQGSSELTENQTSSTKSNQKLIPEPQIINATVQN